MSDVDVDVESDDDNDSDNAPISGSQRLSNPQNSQDQKRAHHNALERKRRDHIKESFTSLREAVPSLKGEKASRAQILKKTTEYIQSMRRQIQANQKEVDDKRKQNRILENKIRLLENSKSGYIMDESRDLNDTILQDSSNDSEDLDFSSRSKKMKTSYQI